MNVRRIALPFVACLALLLAVDAPAGTGGHPSSLIPFWSNHNEPRNFILDSMRLDARILDTIAFRLGATVESRGQNGYCYERRSLGRSAYFYCFRAEWIRAETDTVFVDSNAWSIDSVSLRKGRLFGYYLFDGMSWLEDSPRSTNLAAFLHSAYHQHLYPRYRTDDSHFTPMPTQNQLGLWLRGAVSPVWAQRYASKRDPFSGPSMDGAFSEYGYILDGGFAIILLFGAVSMVVNDHPANDAGAMAIFAAAHSALSLGCFLPIMSLDLGESIRFRKSGYRFPKGLKTE